MQVDESVEEACLLEAFTTSIETALSMEVAVVASMGSSVEVRPTTEATIHFHRNIIHHLHRSFRNLLPWKLPSNSSMEEIDNFTLFYGLKLRRPSAFQSTATQKLSKHST